MESVPWGWSGWFEACTATLVYCGDNLGRDIESTAIKKMVAAAGPGARLVPNGAWQTQVEYHLEKADTQNYIPQVYIGYAPTSAELLLNARAQAAAFGSGLAEPNAAYQSKGNYTQYPVQQGRFTYYPKGYMDVLMLTHGGASNKAPPGGDAVGLIRRAAGWEYVLGYYTTATAERAKYEMIDSMANMIYPSVEATYVHEWVAQASYNNFGMERFWDAAVIKQLEEVHRSYDPCNILWVTRSIGHNQPHCTSALHLP